MAYFDLHSHVLPGLDDGAPDAETSLSMLSGLASIGFDTVFATPHQKAGHFLPDLADVRRAHAAAREAVAAEVPGLTLRLAAENMWDAVLYDRLGGAEPGVPSYDDGLAFLFELPLAPQLPIGLFDRLFQLRVQGRLPVLAHPERYEPLWSDDATVNQLRDSCALVVDLGAVAGYHGRKQREFARRLVTEGTAHAVASDAHSPNDVRVAAEGIAWIRKRVGAAAVTRLLDVNPRRIAAGEHPDE